MKKMLAILAASAHCLAFAAPERKQVDNWGVGAWTCEDWAMSFVQEDMAKTTAVISWVQGFLQGMNAGRDAASMPIPELPATERIPQLIDASCKRAHKNHMIAYASAQIWIVLMQNEEQKRRK